MHLPSNSLYACVLILTVQYILLQSVSMCTTTILCIERKKCLGFAWHCISIPCYLALDSHMLLLPYFLFPFFRVSYLLYYSTYVGTVLRYVYVHMQAQTERGKGGG